MAKGGDASQTSTTITDSQNRYQTINRVFDNAGNVYFNSAPQAGTTAAEAATGAMDSKTMIALAVVGVGAVIVLTQK